MFQISAQTRIFVAVDSVDFRRGMDSLSGVCRQHLQADPLDGALYVFRNRSRTSIRLLYFDGQGLWLATKRLSTGRFRWWPQSNDAHCRLDARALQILLWDDNPNAAQLREDWRQVA